MMAATKQPTAGFNADAIPVQLRALGGWAPWRAVWLEDKQKFAKRPVSWRNPEIPISTAKPDRWTRFTKALSAYEGESLVGDNAHGIGVLMQPQLVGIDIDNAFDDAFAIKSAAEAFISRFADTYAELSPSGKGLRLFAFGQFHRDWTASLDDGVKVECYFGHSPRFLTVTGLRFAGHPPTLMNVGESLLADLFAEFGKPDAKSAEIISIAAPDILPVDALPDLTALAIADPVKLFLTDGEHDGDRSSIMFRVACELTACSLAPDVVFSILMHSPHYVEAALDKRGQDYDRAVQFIWMHMVQKAKRRAVSKTASPDDFSDETDGDGDVIPEAWPALPRDKNGRIDANVANLEPALRCADMCGMDIGFDEFRSAIMCKEDGAWRLVDDNDYTRMRSTLESRGFKSIGRELMRDVAALVAAEQAFDSANLWLSGLTWDGVPRIERFLESYFGCADSDYHRAVSMYMWTALAARVTNPGCQADMVPVLVGSQGLYKSTAIKAIAPQPEWFGEVHLSSSEDDIARRLRGKLVAELAELRGIKTKDVESIRAFITRTTEEWVPKYREFATSYHRRMLFIGSTNDKFFLADPEGHRRWLPVTVVCGNPAAIRRDVEQLWAEAVATYELFGICYKDAERLAKDEYEAYEVRPRYYDEICEWLHAEGDDNVQNSARDFLRTIDVRRECPGIDSKDRGADWEIGKCLRALGYTLERTRVNGKQMRVWSRPE